MKKFLVLLFSLSFVFHSVAADFRYEDISYNIISGSAAEVAYSPEAKGDIAIPEKVSFNNVEYSVISIGYRAFYENRGLTSVVIPNSVRTIGEKAFAICKNLLNVDLPNSLTSIGRYAFGECMNLINIDLPNSVTSIGDYAFAYCTRLTNIKLSNSLASIGDYAFTECESLTSIEIPNSVEYIGRGVFEDSELVEFMVFNAKDCSCSSYSFPGRSLKSLIIGPDVEQLPEGAFSYSINLEWLKFNARDCILTRQSDRRTFPTSMKTIIIGDSVTRIPSSAFIDNTELKSVYIGENVKRIEDDAFKGCQMIEDITIAAIVPPTGKANIFEPFTYTYATLYAPEKSLNGYRTLDPWCDFFTFRTLEESDVNEIVADDSETCYYDIYNIHGQVVKKQALQSEINNLSPGIYIIGGKKIIIF